MRVKTVIALLVVIAGGCSRTTPPRLYTLNMAPSRPEAPTANIEVERLRPIDALDRSSIVIRKSEHEVDTYPLDHWASNLGEMVTKKLAAEFGQPDPEKPVYVVAGDIVAFEQVSNAEGAAAGRVALAVEVRKKGASRYDAPLLARRYEADAPAATPAAADVAAALNGALEEVAARLRHDVASLDPAEEPQEEGERLHTLDMTPSGNAKSSFNIDVTGLRRHEALARNSILVRAGPTTVEYYPDDRWAASVSTLVAEKLEAEFGAPVSGRDTVELSGSILAFERVDEADGAKGHVKLDVTLKASAPQGTQRPLVWKVYESSAPAAGTDARDVADALSTALAQVAAQIAADTDRLPPPEPTKDSRPIHLYTLDMTPSGKADCKYNVQFERIIPHDSLTRADILIVRDKTVVDHFERERWASSLGELVPEKLTAEFGPGDDEKITLSASGALAGFEQVENGADKSALVKLDLTFRWDDDTTALRRVFEAKAPVDGEGAAAAVRALSRALEDAAARIAADLNALTPPQKAEDGAESDKASNP